MIFLTRPQGSCSVELLNQSQFCQSMRQSNCSKRKHFQGWKSSFQLLIINSIGTSNNKNALFSLKDLRKSDRIQLFSFLNQEKLLMMRIFLMKLINKFICFFFNYQKLILISERLEIINDKLFSQSFPIFLESCREMLI